MLHNVDLLRKNTENHKFCQIAARRPGLTLVFDVMWHHNIGHALFDGLYPAYLGLCKFGLQAVPFVAAAGIDPASTRYMSEDIIDVFSGGGLKHMHN